MSRRDLTCEPESLFRLRRFELLRVIGRVRRNLEHCNAIGPGLARAPAESEDECQNTGCYERSHPKEVKIEPSTTQHSNS